MASTAASAAASACFEPAARIKQIAAADRRARQGDRRFTNELAVHHRNAPIALGSQTLRNLPSVAEIAQRIPQFQPLFSFEIAVAGRTRRGQHALSDAVAKLVLQVGRRHREDQHANAGPPVGRLIRPKLPVDGGFATAADDRGRVTRHRHGGLPRPAQAVRGDDDRGGPHAESFGERIVDQDAIQSHRLHDTASKGSATPSALARTFNRSGSRP